MKQAVVQMGWACARALGYGRDEPQRSRLDRRLRLARLYAPSLARAMELRGLKVGESCVALCSWLALGVGVAGVSSWRPGEGFQWAAWPMLAAGAGQLAIARWLFLAAVFEARPSARRAMTGPGGRFEGYLERSAIERSKIAARQIEASAAPGARRVSRGRRL